MKKKQKKLSLEKINIARFTTNMRYISGGGQTVNTDQGCTTCTETTDTRIPDPPTDSSLGCLSNTCTLPPRTTTIP